MNLIEVNEKGNRRTVLINLNLVTEIMDFGDFTRFCFLTENDYVDAQIMYEYVKKRFMQNDQL